MLIGRDKVIDYIRLNRAPYWDIRKTDQGAIIVPGPQEEKTNLDESIDRLTTALELLGPGVYHITCKPTLSTNSKHLLKDNFKIPVEEGMMMHAPAAVGGLTEEEVEKRAMEKYQAMKREDELKDLKERVEELDSGINRVITRIEPYIPALIEGIIGGRVRKPAGTIQGKEAQVAGISSDEEAQERLEKAFERWYEVEKEVDPVELVEKIVEMAENNPEMYKSAKQMLMK